MAITRIVPPLDYLREASRSSLESFELTRLNHAANLRREIGALIDQWVQETSEAMLARWMLDYRKSPHSPQLLPPDILGAFAHPEADPAPEPPISPTDIVPAPPRFGDSRRPLSEHMARKNQKHKQANAD